MLSSRSVDDFLKQMSISADAKQSKTLQLASSVEWLEFCLERLTQIQSVNTRKLDNILVCIEAELQIRSLLYSALLRIGPCRFGVGGRLCPRCW